MKKIGIIGLGAMGRNLALNMVHKNLDVRGYDINGEMRSKSRHDGIKVVDSLDSLSDFFEREKKLIWIMVPSDKVDDVIGDLSEYLTAGDILIEGGNSYFKDTERRAKEAKNNGFLFIGTGISGGEEGALKGPCIMPGGEKDAYNQIESIFKIIAARADNESCCAYIGPGGAGHFVKMVHNGIEYGDMQLIGEVAWFFKNLGMSSVEITDIMTKWNGENDDLRSYLIEITAESLKEKHKGSEEHLVDRIADVTRMKGTGTWTVQSALELLVPIPTIAAAVFSREMSQDKDLRLKMSEIVTLKKPASKLTQDKSCDYQVAAPSEPAPAGLKRGLQRNNFEIPHSELVELAHDALYIAKISSYAQGTALLKAASKEYKFNLNLGEIAKIWCAGCIIRAQFLDDITRSYEENPNLPNLLAAPKFSEFVSKNLEKLGLFIQMAHRARVPTLAMDSAYDYIVQLCSPVMFSAQVATLQRDYFGAHGYFKIGGADDPRIVTTGEGKMREFHTEWMLPGRPEKEVTE